jgi:hypothetical protein
LTSGTAGVAVIACFKPNGVLASAPRLIQTTYTDSAILQTGGSTTWTTQSYPVNPTPGNKLIAIFNGSVYHPATDCGSVVSVTDTAGNTWLHAADSGPDNRTGINLSCWYVDSALGGPTTLTVTFSNASQQLLALLLEFTNLPAHITVDSLGLRADAGSDSPSIITSTNTQPGGFALCYRAIVFPDITHGPGFGWEPVISDTTGAYCEMQLTTPGGIISGDFSGTMIAGINGLLIVFKSGTVPTPGPKTHCLSKGILGIGEMDVPNLSPSNVFTMTPASGLRRGVVVVLHGLAATGTPIPPPLTDTTFPFGFVSYMLTLANLLTADGWVVIQPPYQEDLTASPAISMWNDINSDSTHGGRLLASNLAWWDHVLEYVHAQFGQWPIVPIGVSIGGMRTIQIAKNRQSTIIGYGVHVPATILHNAAFIYTTPANFGNVTTIGVDVQATDLNTVALPGLVGYGTNDIAVGYDLAGTGGTPISNTDAMITNAVALGNPVERNATTDTHEFTAADAAFVANWFGGAIDPSYPRVF